nr:hypothetical protein [Devosia sp. SL43]
MKWADIAFRNSDDADASKVEPLINMGNVFLVARHAVQRFRHNHIEHAARSVVHHPLDAATMLHGGTGNSKIGVDRAFRPAVLRDEFAGLPNLVFD